MLKTLNRTNEDRKGVGNQPRDKLLVVSQGLGRLWPNMILVAW